MNYKLILDEDTKPNISFLKSLKGLYVYLKGSRRSLIASFVFLLTSSFTVVYAPFFVKDVINEYIPDGNKDKLFEYILILAGIYGIGVVANYFQIFFMGRVGQSMLFRLRNAIFAKIQEMPLQFFNQNKAGDLISRINNDTEKLNQAFSETLIRFLGDIFVIIGVGIAMLLINLQLGLIALVVLSIILFTTWLSSEWIQRNNDKSLQKIGELSGQVQESLSNFKVMVVFNRKDYLKDSFEKVNNENRKAATWANIANGSLQPIYNLGGSIATMLIVALGIQILILDPISQNKAPEIGTLIVFMLYADSFFNPLREMAALFAQIQTSIAAWGRISLILGLESNLKVEQSEEFKLPENVLMKFENVNFGYIENEMVLKDINIEIEKGKTYALVGPTGGGKSTTAALMSRLFDVNSGNVILNNRNIKSYTADELSHLVGFILQEPFLFTGSLADNIKYGNENIYKMTNEELAKHLNKMGLEKLMERFNDGLETQISGNAENVSLGQKQLIAFVRILLRQPKLIILDEATANIDTVTEQLLEDIINKLPKDTTKVIIAHRLNTIEKADQIFFIADGTIEKPVNFDGAMGLINSTKQTS